MNTDLLSHAHVQIGVGHNCYFSGEEVVIKNHIVKYLERDPKVIFDVGANNGSYATLLRQRFPSADIYCFEPVPRNFEELLKNTEELNLICENIAIGSEIGTLLLYKAANDEDGSMVSAYQNTLTEIFNFEGNISAISLPMTTMDAYCRDKIEEIDFLKIDIEGHELEALKGALSLIKDRKINIIQFEFNEFNLYSKSAMIDFYNLLSDYSFYRILPNGNLLPMNAYNSMHEIFRYQNIFCLHHKLQQSI